jgi:hypothetical protein
VQQNSKILGICQDRPFSCVKSCHMKMSVSLSKALQNIWSRGQWSRDSNFLGIISCHHNTFSERWEDPKCQLQCWMVIRNRPSFAFQKESSALFWIFFPVLDGTSCPISRLIFLMLMSFFSIPVVFRKYDLRSSSVPSPLYRIKWFILLYNISFFN